MTVINETKFGEIEQKPNHINVQLKALNIHWDFTNTKVIAIFVLKNS